MDGGQGNPDTDELENVAIVADHYGLPLFQYLDHLHQVRERYGDEAARLEVEHALAIRKLRIERQREALGKAKA